MTLLQILDQSNYSLNLYALPLLFIVVIMSAACIKALLNEGINKVTVSLLLLVSSIFLWFFSFFWMYCSTNSNIALWWARASYSGVSLIPATLYSFVVAVLQLQKEKKLIIVFIWVVSIACAAIIIGSDTVIKGVQLFSWGYYPQYTHKAATYLAPFFLFLGMSFHELRKAYCTAPDGSTQQRRIRSFFVAFGIGSLAAVDYLAKFDFPVYPFGYLAIFASIVIMIRTIRKYRLFDITPQFAAESIINTMKDALFVLDADGIIRLLNQSAISLIGLQEKRILGQPFDSFIKSISLADLTKNTSGGYLCSYDFSYDHPQQGFRFLSLAASLMKDGLGNVVAFVCVTRDITDLKRAESELRNAHEVLEQKIDERTVDLQNANKQLLQEIRERKTAEEALRVNEERMYLAMKASRLGFYDLNIKTGETVVNAGYALMLGYEPSEFHETNAKWIERLHTDDRKSVSDIYQSYIKGEIPEYRVEFRQKTKSGDWKWILSIGKILERDADGNPVRMLGTHTDITKEKEAEKQILRSLKEKEVMLKEIHHRVKNNMQVIYSLLNLQAKGIADETVRAMFEESRDRVNSMTMIHEKLYRSKDLAHIDFKDYLQNLVQGIAATYKRHDIHLSIDMENISLDVNSGIPCGLIVNELVSNSFKHAFPDERKGTIKVGLYKKSKGNYVLFVSDNGIGFPETIDFHNTTSLGLQLVNVLAGQINGTIEFSRSDGTRFSISFPDIRQNTSVPVN